MADLRATATPDTDSRLGPRQVCRTTCAGCPALALEDWKDYLDNDETDSGTMARCGAAEARVIGMYWHETYAVPVWCPAGVPAVDSLAAQEQATQLAEAFADLPDQLRAHPGIKRLYRAALGVGGNDAG